jgi:hypothetical protein
MKFAKCMREHGVTVHASTSGGGIEIQIHKDPGSGGPNPESPAFQSAQKACSGLLPEKPGGKGAAGPEAPGASSKDQTSGSGATLGIGG